MPRDVGESDLWIGWSEERMLAHDNFIGGTGEHSGRRHCELRNNHTDIREPRT